MNHNDRELRITAIRNRISDLIYSYIPQGKHGRREPGLLAALDHMAEQLAHATPPATSGHTKPASRPPAALDHLDHARKIRTHAIEWDMRLRNSSKPQTPDLALRSIPDGSLTAPDHMLGQLHGDVRTWHTRALQLLEYIDPPQPHTNHYPNPCPRCGQTQLYAPTHSYTPTCRACNTTYNLADIEKLIHATT